MTEFTAGDLFAILGGILLIVVGCVGIALLDQRKRRRTDLEQAQLQYHALRERHIRRL